MKLSRLSPLVAAVATLGVALAIPARANQSLTTVFSNSSGGTTLNNSAGVDITFNANGTVSVTYPGPGAYDGSEDTLVDVYNNSSKVVTSININGGSNTIFGFDGDGISTYTHLASSSLDTSGYGSPDSYFTNISGNTGTVNFTGGISANGGTDYFSLEEPITGVNGGGTIVVTGGAPDGGIPMALVGGLLVSILAFRRKQCFAV